MDELTEQVKIELKAFGCAWDLIGNQDPEGIAQEFADLIVALILRGIRDGVISERKNYPRKKLTKL